MAKKKLPSDFTNVIVGNAYFDTVQRAAKSLRDFLREFCGPFASHVVIPSKINAVTMIDQYTKDGIDIANTLTTRDPSSDYLARLAKYIGERVNDRCHDGTTTSMLFFCALVARTMEAAKYVYGRIQTGETDKSMLDLSASFSVLFDFLDSTVRENTLTVETIREIGKSLGIPVSHEKAKYALAYHQALVASKGDRDVASAIAEVLIGLPVELYGQYVVKNAPTESETRFVLEKQEEDISFRSIARNRDFNHELNTEIFYPDCDILISTSQIIKGTREYAVLEELAIPVGEETGILRTYVRGDEIERPLVIISPTIADNYLLNLIDNHNQRNPDKRIVPISMGVTERLMTAYTKGVAAMAGAMTIGDAIQETMTLDAAFIRHASLSHKSGVAFVSNLFKHTRSRYHPFYTKRKAHPYYSDTLSSIQKIIEDSVIKHSRKITDDEINLLITLFRSMTCQSPVDIKLTGSTHTQVADRSVVIDAMGAAVAALSDGVVICGYPMLLAETQKHFFIDARHSHTAEACVIGALYDVCSAIYRIDCSKHADFSDYLETIMRCSETQTINLFSIVPQCFEGHAPILPSQIPPVISCLGDETVFRNFIATADAPDTGVRVLAQPVSGYYEQIKRLKDIITKLANSTAILDVRG